MAKISLVERCKLSKKLIISGILCFAATEVTIASYLLKRTLVRNKADVERTKRMSGTEWVKYIPEIKKKKDWLIKQEHEDVYIKSDDNLKLHGILFPKKNSKKIVICLHGYSSTAGISDYTAISRFYLERNFNILMIDARAHGASEGKYIGFGCLDRNDLVRWIEYVISLLGEDCEILLHGNQIPFCNQSSGNRLFMLIAKLQFFFYQFSLLMPSKKCIYIPAIFPEISNTVALSQ